MRFGWAKFKRLSRYDNYPLVFRFVAYPFQHILHGLSLLLHSPLLVAGAGRIEAELARHLQQRAESLRAQDDNAIDLHQFRSSIGHFAKTLELISSIVQCPKPVKFEVVDAFSCKLNALESAVQLAHTLLSLSGILGY